MDRRGHRPRVSLGALALVAIALSLVLLRPVFDTAEGYMPPLAGESCCTLMDDSPSLTLAVPEAPDAKFVVVVLPRRLPELARLLGVPLAGVGLPGIAPTARFSYYARSARILS